MKILIDMNLSPDWQEIFARHGRESVHWSSVGKPTASDETILRYAAENGYVVFTHDLDFSAILAATGAKAPSVIQVRAQDVLSARFQNIVIEALRQFEDVLVSGALVVIDAGRSKARILPLN